MKTNLHKIVIHMSKIGIYVLIMCLSLSLALAIESEAQRKYLDEIVIELSQSTQSRALIDVIREIEANTNFKFAYSKSEIRGEKIDLRGGIWTMDEILKSISVQAQVSFKRINESIGLSPVRKKEELPQIVEEVTPQQNVKGTVVDENGQQLPGASVIVKGTSQGTTTDIDGNYSLNCPEDATLTISFVGYETMEVQVNNRSVVDVQLSLDLEQLEEVVVVGYGSQKKSDLTGAVSQIKTEEISAYPASRLESVLQGRAAGVQVQSSNGEPGSAPKVRIRGATSVNSSSDPLYVVDGFPGGAIPGPEDIASVEVLKDASATAIYGSRGANGVILITTKRGRKGANTLEFNTSYSVQEEIGRFDLLETPDYLDYMDAASPGTFDPSGTYPNTDWQDEVFQNGGIQNYQLSLSGGGDNVSYYVSGVVYDQKGIIIDSEYERYSFTSNLDIQATDNIKFGANLFGARYTTNGTRTQEGSGGGSGAGVASAAVLMEPIVPVFNPDGSYAISPIGDPHDNPVAIAKERTIDRVGENLQGNFYGEVQLLEDLTFKSTLGIRMWSSRNGEYTPKTLNAGVNVGGQGSIQGNRNTDFVTEHYLTYSKKIGEAHNLLVMGGYSYQSFRAEQWRAESQNFINDAFIFWDLDGGSVPRTPESSLTESELASYYGRINYKLFDKYLFTINARYDGSSRFAKNQKWAFFPSGSVAWVLSEEAFLSGVDQINQLKIRASYGVTGNQAIGPYQSLARLRTLPSTVINNTLVNAVGQSSVANNNLTWESTAQTNIGIDLGLYQSRISLTMDYYRMETTDLLFELELPKYSGYPDLLKNIGTIENKGIELTLSTVNFERNGFKWMTDINFSRNRNKILSLPDGNDLFQSSAPGHMVGIGNTQILRVGQPMGQFFGFVYDGVYQEGDTFLPGAGFEQEAGGEKFRDITGEGELDAEDRTIIGDPNPDFIWGLNNTLEYKGFDLNVFFHAIQGNDIYSFTLFEIELLSGLNNTTKEAYNNSWTPENPNTDVPKITDARSRISSDRFIYDGSFIRLKNISLGYKLPKAFLSRIGVEFARVYVSGQNILTFTNYPGIDPEVNWRGGGAYGGNVNIGLDYGSYPNSKSYTVGLQVRF